MLLIWNAGSSSLKAKLYDVKAKRLVLIKSASVARIGENDIKNHTEATSQLINGEKLQSYNIKVVAYRVVHSGGVIPDGSEASEANIKKLKEISNLAPLHNPPAIENIKVSKKVFSKQKHKLFFDTAFFDDLPVESKTYPLPLALAEKEKIKKFGFHGISHKYALEESGTRKSDRVISIHLGAGCSVCAIVNKKPLDTSMGLTPSGGVIMQSRTGDIDPGIVFYIIRKLGAGKTEKIINNESGLAGLTGTSGNMYDVLYLAGQKIEDSNYLPPMSIKKDAKSTEDALLALKLYANSIKKYIGGYATLMGGVDLVIFTGKIGAGSSVIRDMVMEGLEFLKIKKVVKVEPDEEKAIAKMLV
jgi:acetate kinase